MAIKTNITIPPSWAATLKIPTSSSDQNSTSKSESNDVIKSCSMVARSSGIKDLRHTLISFVSVILSLYVTLSFNSFVDINSVTNPAVVLIAIVAYGFSAN
ncbi:MAG: hypothetical protein P8163_14205 [Candidatus Thiodiazotropha sp.]